MIYQIEATITVPVQPTEVTDRVIAAVENVFPTATIETEENRVRARTHSLSRLSEHLHQREILDTARSEFHANRRPDGFSFAIKKQPAFVDVVTFVVGEPSELGEIDVDVTVMEPDVQTVIDHVAPPTEDGVPITEREAQSG